jgi:hypothetical protein
MVAALALGQQLGSMDAPQPRLKHHVTFVAEPQTVGVGRQAILELKFRVDNGFHVNSHSPKSELQIATRVAFTVASGVKVAAAEYPAGKLFSFAFDPTETLDVYTDQFVVKVPVVATPGEHELKGELTYQACDHAACFPPRTLPVDVIFQAK